MLCRDWDAGRTGDVPKATQYGSGREEGRAAGVSAFLHHPKSLPKGDR